MRNQAQLVQRLTDILVKHKVVNNTDGELLKSSFEKSAIDNYVDFLLTENIVDDVNVLRALGEYFQVPAFDVVGHFFDHALLHQFPKGFLLRNEIIPLDVDEAIMVVVASDPGDDELLVKIGKYVGYDVQFRVGLARDIIDAVEDYYDKAITEDDEDSDLNHEARLQREAERIEEGDIEIDEIE